MTTQRFLIWIGKTYNAKTRAIRVGHHKVRAYKGIIKFDVEDGRFEISLNER